MELNTKKRIAAGSLIAALVATSIPATAAAAQPSQTSITQGVIAGDTSTENTLVSVQGGVTKVKKHWWGFAVYLNTEDANIVAGGGAIASALLARLGLPGAIISVIIAIGSGALLACKGSKGVYIHAAWVGPSWCKRQ